MKTTSLSRRIFLKNTALTGATLAALPTLVPASVFGASAPSNRVVVGCIGVGPQGQGDMSGFLHQNDVHVAAVSDVKTDQLAQAKAQVDKHYQNEDCKAYGDFRELLAREDVDACLIATPDHWHVPVGIAACKAGKDIYLEKPMGLSLEDNWALRRACHKHDRVFQFGTQQRSSRIFRLACALVRNGKIGTLKTINVWAPGSAPGGSTRVVPVPANLNYDLWLGPAQFRPHTEDLCTHDGYKKTWWFISDFALGFIAGWGIHPMDIAVWGADLFSGPIEVEGRGSFNAYGACDTATVWNVNMKFANRVTMTFVGVPNGGNSGASTYDAWPQEEDWKNRYRRITTHGTAFEGSDGWVHVDREGINLEPQSLIDLREEELDHQLVKSSHHARNFIDSVRSRKSTVCPIDESVRSDTLCHLSDIAIRTNRKLTWDPKKEHFINDEGANQRLKTRPGRKPWEPS